MTNRPTAGDDPAPDVLGMARAMTTGTRFGFGVEVEVVAARLREIAGKIEAGTMYVSEVYRLDRVSQDDFSGWTLVVVGHSRKIGEPA